MFKISNLGLTLSMALKFYTSVTKGLKLKIRKILGLAPTFVEVTGEKLVEVAFLLSPSLLFILKNVTKRNEKAKLCYLDTDSFTVLVKAEDIYKDIANNLNKGLIL